MNYEIQIYINILSFKMQLNRMSKALFFLVLLNKWFKWFVRTRTIRKGDFVKNCEQRLLFSEMAEIVRQDVIKNKKNMADKVRQKY